MRKILGIFIAALVVILVVTLVVVYIVLPGINTKGSTTHTSSTSSASTGSTKPTKAQIKEVKKLLTFKEVTYQCTTQSVGGLKLLPLVIHAAPVYGPSSPSDNGYTPKRVNSHDLSVPLIGTTTAELSTSFDSNLCIDPLTGFTWGYVVGNLKIPGTNLTVKQIAGDKFMKLTDVPLKDLNNLAEKYVLSKNATSHQITVYIARNHQYQAYIEKLISLLQQAKILGVAQLQSLESWRLNGLSAGIADVVKSPVPDKLPALLLGETEKGQCTPDLLFGVNLEDQRPEVFKPSDYTALFCKPHAPPKGHTPPCTVAHPCNVNTCTWPLTYESGRWECLEGKDGHNASSSRTAGTTTNPQGTDTLTGSEPHGNGSSGTMDLTGGNSDKGSGTPVATGASPNPTPTGTPTPTPTPTSGGCVTACGHANG